VKYLLQLEVDEAFETAEEIAAQVRGQLTTDVFGGRAFVVKGLHAGADYDLPFEDIPGGEVNVDAGYMAGALSVGAGALPTEIFGNLPLLAFEFRGPEREPLRVTLVMDDRALRSVRTLVGTAIDRAILHARRMPRRGPR
jgi:hypothetical protein